MNRSHEEVLDESTKLLSRLKIVHSFSNNQNRDKIYNGKLIDSKVRSASNKVPLQSVLDNKATKVPSINSISIFKKKNIHGNNSNNTEKNPEYKNKTNNRSISTLGRFLSTPYGTKNQEFLNEFSQGILTNKIKKIVIMVGAGVSCPSGIPDFRTPGSGLYDNLKQYKIPYPEAIFDIQYFMSNPKPFFTLAKELFPLGQYRPNKVHYFFKLLEEKNLLLRVYTQNIDGLERLAGVSDSHLVEAHGTFASATCLRCGQLYSGEYVKTSMDTHNISRCSKCKGIVKPDIVFFGEDLPPRFRLYTSDFRNADMLLVMGTSLEVEPFASIVEATRFGTPRLLLNKHAVGVFRSKKRINDHCLLGDIVDSTDMLVSALGWGKDLQMIIDNGEKNKISFLDTISKSTNNHNLKSLSIVHRKRTDIVPTVPKISHKSNNTRLVQSNDSKLFS